MTRRIVAALALAVAAALTLAGCGQGDSPDATRTVAHDPAAATDGFDDADVAFAQQMIPHHQQAVLMARMAESHAARPDVRRLAAGIEAAQGPEIETMRGWLEDWGEDVPDGSFGHLGHHGMNGMNGMGGMAGMGGMRGMMSDRQLDSLGRAQGDAWDRMFLRMMVAHHEGAIDMARTEVAEGENADAVALAERIIEAQQAEIEQMERMLSS